MDNSFPTAGNRQQQRGIPARLTVFQNMLDRLMGLFRLSEEEQKDAGVSLGDADEEGPLSE